VKVDAAQLAGSTPPAEVSLTLSAMESNLLAADVSKQTHDSIMAQVGTQAGAQAAPPSPPKTDSQPAMSQKNNAPPANPKTPPNQIQQAQNAQSPNQQPAKPQPKPPTPRPPDANMIAGLLLGSPEFQRR
jgi:hypothetical protein